MKKLKRLFSLLIVITITFIVCSCNQDASPSLFQTTPPGSTPVISSISPANKALAGVSEITISGSNFSSVNNNNLVFFGGASATVLQSSPTQIVVKAPNSIASNIDIKVAVQGVENFSNIVKYNLAAAVGIYYNFVKGVDQPMVVAVDKNENIYVNLADKGIKKISPTGDLSDWAPKGGESFFFDLKMGPNNILYGTRNVRAIFQIQQGSPSATFITVPTGNSLVALDFDANGNIWTGGSGGNIYSITNPGKVTTAFAIDYVISSVRVYDGYLYVAGKKSTEEAIYRYKINSSTSLGSVEKYFDIDATYGLGKVKVGAIAFSADGDLIMGTDQTNAFILVRNGAASTFYPGLILPYVRSLEWGTQNNLFYIREYNEAAVTVRALIRVDMQKLSAPYYGRQ
ncbi:MAG: IPT/TIG domain-containing protein [Bacteroidetes bacterium]|nr:IPT/TIG domain-containing protein [Bacteroidota bacterium]